MSDELNREELPEEVFNLIAGQGNAKPYSIAGRKPTVMMTPEEMEKERESIPPRLTIREQIYHSERGKDPTQIDLAHHRFLTRSEQVYVRHTVIKEGTPFKISTDWVEGDRTIVIVNRGSDIHERHSTGIPHHRGKEESLVWGILLSEGEFQPVGYISLQDQQRLRVAEGVEYALLTNVVGKKINVSIYGIAE